MISRCAGELSMHWARDITFRTHKALTVFNQLQQPHDLSEELLIEYRSKPSKEKGTVCLLTLQKLKSSEVGGIHELRNPYLPN